MPQPPKTDLARELWETCPKCYGDLLVDRDGGLYCPQGHYRAANATSLPSDVNPGQELVADGGASDAPGDDARAAGGGTPAIHGEYGRLVDGHGRRLYKVAKPTARLHHKAIAAGWRHSYELTPYHNLRAVVELVDADRRGYERFAYRFILGYGPGSTPRALKRLGVTA